MFKEFNKIPRLSRHCVITEKIDGSNGCIIINEDGDMFTQSRNRIITPDDDNYGFSQWAYDNYQDLLKLGAGYHYGEWWGSGIQKRYTISDKRFYLFNVHRWANESARPDCCGVVPVICEGIFTFDLVDEALSLLINNGSYADPNCKRPEGIIIYHEASKQLFKKTIEKDEEHKSKESV